MKKLLFIALFLPFCSMMNASTFPCKTDFIIDIVASGYTRVTANDYPGANSVTVQLLNQSDQVLASAQTTPERPVTFDITSGIAKVRVIYYFDGGQYVIMDEENM